MNLLLFKELLIINKKLSYGYKFRRSYIGKINKLKESNLKYLLV